MRKKRVWLFAVLAITIFACSKENDSNPPISNDGVADNFVGKYSGEEEAVWNNIAYTDLIFLEFEKVDANTIKLIDTRMFKPQYHISGEILNVVGDSIYSSRLQGIRLPNDSIYIVYKRDSFDVTMTIGER